MHGFKTDEIMDAENALMDISFTKSFPTIKSLNSSNQFKSTQLFKHKSIRDSTDNNDDLQFNMSISDNDSKNIGLHLNISDKSDKSNEVSDSSNSSKDDYENDDEDESEDEVFKSVTILMKKKKN